MNNEKTVDVRVDFYKNGDFFPIAFIDYTGKTNYIRNIIRIEDQYVELNKLQKLFYCVTSEKNCKLIWKDNKWYIEE